MYMIHARISNASCMVRVFSPWTIAVFTCSNVQRSISSPGAESAFFYTDAVSCQKLVEGSVRSPSKSSQTVGKSFTICLPALFGRGSVWRDFPFAKFCLLFFCSLLQEKVSYASDSKTKGYLVAVLVDGQSTLTHGNLESIAAGTNGLSIFVSEWSFPQRFTVHFKT